MQKVISIGKQNFVSLRENDCFYIDKTDLICKWWESKDEITLITRPRRFGKNIEYEYAELFLFQSIYRTGKTFLKDWQSGKRKSIVKCKEPIR